jgi:hypothetical protein
MSKSAQKR